MYKVPKKRGSSQTGNLNLELYIASKIQVRSLKSMNKHLLPLFTFELRTLFFRLIKPIVP